jgi:hypothetical protein
MIVAGHAGLRIDKRSRDQEAGWTGHKARHLDTYGIHLL